MAEEVTASETTPESPLLVDDTAEYLANLKQFKINNDHLSEYETFFVFEDVSSSALIQENEKEFDLNKISLSNIYPVAMTNLSYGEAVDKKPVFAAGHSYFVGVETNVVLVAGRIITFSNQDEEETPFPYLLKKINELSPSSSYNSIVDFDFPLNLFVVNKLTGKAVVFYNVFFNKKSSEYNIQSPDRYFVVDFFATNYDSCNMLVRSGESINGKDTLLDDHINSATKTISSVEDGLSIDFSYNPTDEEVSSAFKEKEVKSILSTPTKTDVLAIGYTDSGIEYKIETPFVPDKDGFITIPFAKKIDGTSQTFAYLKVSLNDIDPATGKPITSSFLKKYIEDNVANIYTYFSSDAIKNPKLLTASVSQSVPKNELTTVNAVSVSGTPAVENKNVVKESVSYIITTKSGSRIREKANSDSKVSTTLAKGTKLKVLTSSLNNNGEGWYQVEYESKNIVGWIYYSLVAVYCEFIVKVNTNLYNTNYVPKATVLKKLVPGDKLIWIKTSINGVKEEWHYCELLNNKTTGWVIKSSVERVL